MFTYAAHNPLTRAPVGQIPLINVTFNDPIDQSGTLTGAIVIGPDTNVEQVRAATERFNTIYALYGRSVLWGGLITGRSWDPAAGQVTVTAQQASWYLTRRIAYKSLPQGQAKTWTNVDQFTIVRDIITDMCARPGSIQVGFVDAATSGITRTYTHDPSSQATVNDLIDTFANAADGFEWRITPRFSARDGWPEWVLGLWHPEYADVSRPMLHASTKGGNLLSYGPWAEDWTGVVTDVTILGAGSAPYQRLGKATNARLGSGRVLLEKVDSFTDIGDQATLNSYASRELQAYGETTTALTVTTTVDNPSILDYQTGSRPRLRIRDAWLDVDFPAIKIVDRQITDATRTSVAQVTLTLDLAQYTLPADVLPTTGN